MVLILIVAIIAFDQITKYLIRANFEVGETLPVISNIFHLTYVRNRGAAFSLFQGSQVITLIIPILTMVIGIGILLYIRKKGEKILSIAVAMVVAGGIGNLIDRMAFGYVTDFLDFRIFPVFNIADISVTLGCVIAIIAVLFFDKQKETSSNKFLEDDKKRK